MKKIRYVFKENWSFKILGFEIFENKNIKFSLGSVLYTISIFFYWFLSFMSITDLYTLDPHKILSSKINFNLVILSSIWGFVSWISYKIL